MSSADAFGFAASGSMNETAAAVYDQQMNTIYNQFGNLTGWLGEALDQAKEKHDFFMRSRLWEFGKKLKNNEGSYVGRYQIGYLAGLTSQREAEGFMRDIIMANPTVRRLYDEGRVHGYGGELNRLSTGLERDNYYFNKVMDGALGYVEVNDERQYRHTHYRTTRDRGTHYSTRERHDSHRTWRGSDIHINAGYDPTYNGMMDGEAGKVLTVEQGLAKLKAMNESKE